MVNVKPRAVREANYKRAIAGVAGAYRDGVSNATGVIQASKDGQALYETRMRDPEILGKRLRGLEKVTDADWKKASIEKGSVRIADGMTQGAAKQSANFEPIAQALAALQLTPRSADPMQNIDNRVKPVVRTIMEAAKGR